MLPIVHDLPKDAQWVCISATPGCWLGQQQLPPWQFLQHLLHDQRNLE
jgi:hypothetical protein